MLKAVREWTPSADLCGIELDTRYADSTRIRLGKHSNIITGNAFSWETISQLPTNAFDFVITNPPYVRYQTYSTKSKGESFDANSVRSGLLSIISQLPSLNDTDRKILATLAQSYSGLSDLAIPSWILCAALVKPGGTLAMVAPESWLTRDFADVIRYLLLKLFLLRWTVENEARDWFKDAQIKTCLLVAKRTTLPRALHESISNESYLRVVLRNGSQDSRGPSGGLFPDKNDPDTLLRELIISAETQGSCSRKGISINRYNLSADLNNLLATSSSSIWLRNLEPWIKAEHLSASIRRAILPQPLLSLLSAEVTDSLQSPEQLGLKVGQGLRTGANTFFYCDNLMFGEEFSLVAQSRELGKSVLLPSEVLYPVLRKQDELSEGFALHLNKLQGRLLILDAYSPPELDIPEPGRRLMPEGLRGLVLAAQHTKVSTSRDAKLIPELSAVRTNVVPPRAKNNWIARHWFMLPPLTHRHKPDLFVARVNYIHPKTLLNPNRTAIIDANFSTLWVEPTISGPDILAFLAIMNSAWCLAAMELIGTVMGGGALKLEATHIRRLPIPRLSAQEWGELRLLGHDLASNVSPLQTMERIDIIIATRLFGDSRAVESLAALRTINSTCLGARRKNEI
jgi:hypothetical protein